MTEVLIALAALPFVLGSVGAILDWEASVQHGLCAVGGWAGFLACVLEGWVALTVVFGALTAIFTYLWWKNRRGGRWKKAARALGAKSKARVEALVRQMTPSPIPSPAGSAVTASCHLRAGIVYTLATV